MKYLFQGAEMMNENALLQILKAVTCYQLNGSKKLAYPLNDTSLLILQLFINPSFVLRLH
jgi:hypothetical protein